MTVNGIDVSEYQPANIIELTKPPLAAIQVTNGEAYVSPNSAQQMTDALKYSSIVIAYHFCQGLDHGKEMKHFLSQCAVYKGRIAYALDYEGNATKRGQTWIEDCAAYVLKETGVRPFIYVDSSDAKKFHTISDKGYPLWVAVRNGSHTYMRIPKTSYDGWDSVISQYTDTGRITGYDGPLDLNAYDADAATFHDYYITPPKPAATPRVISQVVITYSDGSSTVAS